jgi:hypothetical protein
MTKLQRAENLRLSLNSVDEELQDVKRRLYVYTKYIVRPFIRSCSLSPADKALKRSGTPERVRDCYCTVVNSLSVLFVRTRAQI